MLKLAEFFWVWMAYVVYLVAARSAALFAVGSNAGCCYVTSKSLPTAAPLHSDCPWQGAFLCFLTRSTECPGHYWSVQMRGTELSICLISMKITLVLGKVLIHQLEFSA
jgi:hypothetical protein